jgi:hypothetical protein
MKNKNLKPIKHVDSQTIENKLSGSNSYINIELFKTGLYWFTFGLIFLLFVIVFLYFLKNSIL